MRLQCFAKVLVLFCEGGEIVRSGKEVVIILAVWAAARSQANTAKLLAENPVLQRLNELELLKDVLANTKTTFVFGPGEIAEQIRGLVSKE